ncbi:MAG: SDR family NAD(P)-dependent oxidoreductase [Parvibaculum sp.]|nr:SDR family NAD(P)-dependent oxidoreductase [Parvibaculum sp.]
MQRIVIFGATSGIAEATAREFAKTGASFFLVGRNAQALGDIAADLKVRGAASVETRSGDLSLLDTLPTLCQEALSSLGGIDVALIAHGTLPAQQTSTWNARNTLEFLQENVSSQVALMSELRLIMMAQGRGTLVILSSVAGDRGRPSNYIYGSAKSLLSTLGEGMALELAPLGIKVLVVKPGFVDTKMTAAFKKGALWASASDVGTLIFSAIRSGKSGVLYAPRFWQLIMLIIKFAPSFLVRRM